jgi:hypothetical protein
MENQKLLHIARSKAKKFKRKNHKDIKEYKKINFNDDYSTENHEFFFKEGILISEKDSDNIMLAIKYTVNQYNDFYTCISKNKKVIISKKRAKKIKS